MPIFQKRDLLDLRRLIYRNDKKRERQREKERVRGREKEKFMINEKCLKGNVDRRYVINGLIESSMCVIKDTDEL